MNTEIQISNKRNDSGVKNFTDQYRIINGVHFFCAISGQINAGEKAAEYKAKGARVRRVGDDVYVASEDLEKIL
jgi:hypothetical protein